MGRRISSEKNNFVFIHPVVSFSFLVAWIMATIIITATLCGTRSRKAKLPPKAAASSSSTHGEDSRTEQPTTIIMVSEPTATEKENSTEMEIHQQQQELQPPAFTKWKEYSSHEFLTLSSASKRKLSSTLSMKLPRAMSMRFRDGKQEQEKDNRKQFKPEESIWTKTIILGEKCRVPTEEDAIIYDEKGKRLTSYPSRAPRSLPVSRSNSFAFPPFEECKFSRIDATSTANQ